MGACEDSELRQSTLRPCQKIEADARQPGRVPRRGALREPRNRRYETWNVGNPGATHHASFLSCIPCRGS